MIHRFDPRTGICRICGAGIVWINGNPYSPVDPNPPKKWTEEQLAKGKLVGRAIRYLV